MTSPQSDTAKEVAMSPRSIPENQPPLFHDFKNTDKHQELVIQYEIELNELQIAFKRRVEEAFKAYLDEYDQSGAK